MKLKSLKKTLFSFLLLFWSVCFFGQQTEIDANLLSAYNNAIQQYNNKAYAAAQQNFINVIKNNTSNTVLKANANFYDAMCAIKLKQTNADEKVINFVKKYPNSNKKNNAFFSVGNHYFANKKASYALKWFEKVDVNSFSKELKKELDFKMGYAFLVTRNLTLAKKKFLPLINDAKYGNDSRYYYGYIAYKQEEYTLAEATLAEIADKESYRNEITYYLLDISFKAGRFERCVEVGKKILAKSKKKMQSEISKIIGESYFNLKKYKEAIPYLKVYRGKKGKWNNIDYYQLGYAYYKQNDFKNAIGYFNRIIGANDGTSQNAYYHLGECYLNLDKKLEALNAFKSASEMNFNYKIKEDAALNYAKLSYEEGNPYKNVADVLLDFLKKYPKSPNYNEVNDLIVTSFLHQQDYKGALNYLENSKLQENKILIKEVSLYRGIQLFNQQKIAEAYPFFTIANTAKNNDIKTESAYWKSESDYRLGHYVKAIDGFLLFKKLPKNQTNKNLTLADYTIAYSYFKQKKYSEATVFFQNFINQNSDDITVKNDAISRLGDCYFAVKKYQKAIKNYATIVNTYADGADYAQYQIAMSYGFIGNNNQKTKELTALVNNFSITSLKDDALYQLGSTYTTLKNNKKAHEAFNRLEKKYPKSVYIPKSLLRQGLLYFNNNQNEKALEKFKKTVKLYPNSKEALEAVANGRNVYIETGNINEYLTWIKDLKFINITNVELDNTLFEAAEKVYLEHNYKNAIVGFQKYLGSFPKGIQTIKAHFYLAESYFNLHFTDLSIEQYQSVVDNGQSDYSEESLNKLSQIYLEKEDWNNALPYLDQLEQEGNNPQNIIFAQSNLMKGYYKTEAFELAIDYAKKILSKNKIDAIVATDAKIIIARAAIKTNDLLTAEEFYLEVEKTATGILKVEALYYKAFFLNKYKDYEDSNKVIQQLIADYSTYKYWGVKSYIMMAKNHYGLKDAYQATYILESTIKNFTQFKDLIEEAKTELKKIKKNEAKTNNSVTPEK